MLFRCWLFRDPLPSHPKHPFPCHPLLCHPVWYSLWYSHSPGVVYRIGSCLCLWPFHLEILESCSTPQIFIWWVCGPCSLPLASPAVRLIPLDSSLTSWTVLRSRLPQVLPAHQKWGAWSRLLCLPPVTRDRKFSKSSLGPERVDHLALGDINNNQGYWLPSFSSKVDFHPCSSVRKKACTDRRVEFS